MDNDKLTMTIYVTAIFFRTFHVFFLSPHAFHLPLSLSLRTGHRDVLNEKPMKEDEKLIVAPSMNLARAAVIHTNMGDIFIKLFSDEYVLSMSSLSTRTVLFLLDQQCG